LHLDLIRVCRYDLRDSQVGFDFPGHAYVLIAVGVFRTAEFLPVASPNDQREYLIGVLLVEVDERGLAFPARNEVNPHDLPAHGGFLPHVISRLPRRDVSCLRAGNR